MTVYEPVPTPYGTAVNVTGPWTPDARAEITSGTANGVILNYARGFTGDNLDFLEGLPLQSVDVTAFGIPDFDVLATLPALRQLRIRYGSGAIPLHALSRLESLSANWHMVRGQIEYVPLLRDLLLGGFAGHSLRELESLGRLEKLSMKDQPALQSLEGVKHLTALRRLEIGGGERLVDIEEVASGAGTLRHLALPGCIKIPDLEPLAACRDLLRVDLDDIGDVPSIAPLAYLTGLRQLWLSGSTRVMDADLSPLLHLAHLERLGMKKRRMYGSQLAVIQALIEARGLPVSDLA